MDDIKVPKLPKTDRSTAPPPEPSLEELRSSTSVPLDSFNESFDTPETATTQEYVNPTPPKSKRFNKRPSKKVLIISGIIITLLIGVLVYVIAFGGEEKVQETVQQVTKSEPAPEPPPPPISPLTGRELQSEELAKRPVTGIMIENSPDARPQSGLYQADMVYEAIAEGGVTRFLSVYQESTPDYIGPIRSARPYYLDYILGLDGSFGHVGGSPEALQDIKTLGVKDLDQFYNAAAYTRITSRYAPHNVYSSFEQLDTLNKQKGYTSSTFTPLIRKIDVPQTPTAQSITLALSGPNYNAVFDYDPTSNSYLRFQAGNPHTDERTGKQINPKVVVALVTNKSYDPDGYHTEYQTTGSGKVFVFQDGIVSEGTWSKPDRKASLTLTDKNGFPLKLNKGQTWLTLVSSGNDVRYTSQ